MWLQQPGSSPEAIVAVADATADDQTKVEQVAKELDLGVPVKVVSVPLAYETLATFWETLDEALSAGTVPGAQGVGLEIRPDLGAIVATIPNDAQHAPTGATLSTLVPEGILLIQPYDPGDAGKVLISRGDMP